MSTVSYSTLLSLQTIKVTNTDRLDLETDSHTSSQNGCAQHALVYAQQRIQDARCWYGVRRARKISAVTDYIDDCNRCWLGPEGGLDVVEEMCKNALKVANRISALFCCIKDRSFVSSGIVTSTRYVVSQI